MLLPHEIQTLSPLYSGTIRAQSECPASWQAGSYIGGVSTASSLAIGSTYTRGARYSYVDRVLLTMLSKMVLSKSRLYVYQLVTSMSQ